LGTGARVEAGAPVYIYESLDADRPVGESRITWQGRFSRYVFRNEMTVRDEALRPPSTREPAEGEWTVFWEVSDLHRLPEVEEFEVSDLSTVDGHRISQAFVPHGPTPVAG